MPTRQERLNYAIAAARNTRDQIVKDSSLSGLASNCVVCPHCDGTGLPENESFRRIEFCKMCNGRGYMSVNQPKKPASNFPSLDTRNGTR